MTRDSSLPFRKRLADTFLPFISIGLLFLLWVIASRGNTELVPSPSQVFDRLILIFIKPVNGFNIFGHIWASLRRVFIALSLSTILGVSFGIMIGWNRSLEAIFGTLFELIRPIPPIAWLPIIIMWFGIGEFPKVLIVFIGTLMPIVVNTYTGIKMVPPLDLDVGRMFNANGRQLLTEIAIPSSLTAVFAGIRNATSAGWMTVLAAEMIGAKEGLGFLITRGTEFFDIPLIMVGMIAIGLVGAALTVVIDRVERLICPWKRKTR